MDRMEPYIGMPIVLGDADIETTCDTMPPAKPPQQSQPPQQPPHHPPQEQPPQSQPCLTDPSCENGGQHQVPQQTMMVGMAYVPWQRWQQPYDYEKGFEIGTMFPDLNLPFLGIRRRQP